MNRYLIPLLLAACFSISSCSNDNEPEIPNNAITLNMMNSDNGRTTIGGTDVYINSSNNFVSSNYRIADLGNKGSFNQNPNLTQIANEIAVTPGNSYQIVKASDITDIAGKRAYPVNRSYLCMHVDSWLYDSDNTISGAKIQYAECTPEQKILPEWDASIPVNMNSSEDEEWWEHATYAFEKGVEIDSDYVVYARENSNLKWYLNVTIRDNMIMFANSSYIPYGKAEVVVKVRYGSLYSKVHLFVNSSI